MNSRRLPHYILIATFIWLVGCATGARNPLEGWKGGLSLYQGGHLDEPIMNDYKDYVRSLPPEESSLVDEFLIKFFEDGTGQHAVEISIPLHSIWWKHVLIYDKGNKRIKVIKYSGGRYQS
jgi:hypothetical protein